MRLAHYPHTHNIYLVSLYLFLLISGSCIGVWFFLSPFLSLFTLFFTFVYACYCTPHLSSRSSPLQSYTLRGSCLCLFRFFYADGYVLILLHIYVVAGWYWHVIWWAVPLIVVGYFAFQMIARIRRARRLRG